jgi:hypothetical protein
MTCPEPINFFGPTCGGVIDASIWSRLLALASAADGFDVAPYRMDRQIVRLTGEQTRRLAEAIDAGAERVELETAAYLATYVEPLRKGPLTLFVADRIVDVPDEALAMGGVVELTSRFDGVEQCRTPQ